MQLQCGYIYKMLDILIIIIIRVFLTTVIDESERRYTCGENEMDTVDIGNDVFYLSD